jgi:hypothetical protein
VSREPEDTEWHLAVAAMSEVERAPYDDPETYADTHWGAE